MIHLRNLLDYLKSSDIAVECAEFVPELWFQSLAPLHSATENQLSFLANSKFARHLDHTTAGAVFMAPGLHHYYGGLALITPNPYLAYAKTSQFVQALQGDVLGVDNGIHATAVVHPTVILGRNCAIGPGVCIGAHSEVGEDVHIGANSVIGRHVKLGRGCRLASQVAVYDHVTFGQFCRVQSHATIGSDGFGFAPTSQGWEFIAQLGSVTIGDHVHIGANTSIDRGALEDTVISNGVIIDNQVQIAHNVVLGINTAIAGCVGIAGSTKIGANCTLAGAAGLAGHLDITDDVHIGMQAQVTKSIAKPGHYASGTGLYPLAQWRRIVVKLRQLVRL